MLTNLEDVRGYDPIEINRYHELLSGLEGYDPSGYHNYFRTLDDPRLDLFNAAYSLSRTPPADPRWQAVFTDPGGVTVYYSRTALPRAYLVYDAEIAADPQQSLTRTLDATFDPHHSVILEENPAGWSAPPNPPPAPPVTFSERSANTLRLEVDTPLPALLVLLDSYDPGWRAAVDQQPTPVYPANHAFRAIVIPAGRHTVSFAYTPPGLIWGIGITLTALAIMAILLIWTLVANPKHKEEQPA
jgi:hypothetical protein